MRIPLHKVYRAFPEFDRFSDERCEAYMLYVGRRYAGSLTAVGLLVWLGAIVGTLVGLVPAVRIGAAISRWYAKSPYPPDEYWVISILLPLAALMLACALVALVVRDVHLRSVMRKQLKGITCPGCSYSLLGAVVQEGCVRCPECGDVLRLAERGLRVADFQVGSDDLPGVGDLPPDFRQTPVPAPDLDPAHKGQLLSLVRARRSPDSPAPVPAGACTRCGFNLAGLAPVESVLRCPECGQGHTIIDTAEKAHLVEAVERTRASIERRSRTSQS